MTLGGVASARNAKHSAELALGRTLEGVAGARNAKHSSELGHCAPNGIAEFELRFPPPYGVLKMRNIRENWRLEGLWKGLQVLEIRNIRQN